MDTNTLIAIAVVVVAAIVLFFGTLFLRARQQNKLIEYLQDGNFDQFFKSVDSLLTKYLFPRYNVEYLKLNGYILQGNEEPIEQQFDLLLRLRKNKEQSEDITMKAFNYYVGIENNEKCEELITTIRTFTNERMINEANTMYDIFILKNGDHIDELLETLDSIPEDGRGINEYLLAVQYENIGDTENAKKYEKLSKKHLEAVEKNQK